MSIEKHVKKAFSRYVKLLEQKSLRNIALSYKSDGDRVGLLVAGIEFSTEHGGNYLISRDITDVLNGNPNDGTEAYPGNVFAAHYNQPDRIVLARSKTNLMELRVEPEETLLLAFQVAYDYHQKQIDNSSKEQAKGYIHRIFTEVKNTEKNHKGYHSVQCLFSINPRYNNLMKWQEQFDNARLGAGPLRPELSFLVKIRGRRNMDLVTFNELEQTVKNIQDVYVMEMICRSIYHKPGDEDTRQRLVHIRELLNPKIVETAKTDNTRSYEKTPEQVVKAEPALVTTGSSTSY